ncbi:P-loop containing nucleoside triphosphate hydrolase protein [Dioszegia hungarica]|uniref:P-loop containing nucleoside triphosphate hydrolase protein n=1 Tax=Dioszegia hungarica TaxID=4972 RepID=A0AA38LR77_9TREE|nr:P-loop containing nucleoside triphosphate hydrolase protein [Dioszegia hungarica]KAI9632685.1 P-loop containing nucleoside triphosphate hydrolase protein [Dioszegia hungarica]
MRVPLYHPAPAPSAVFGGEAVPRKRVNPLSRIFFFWVAPILKLGYSRPLQATDVWDLEDFLRAKPVADRLQEYFQSRLPPSKRTKGYRLKDAPVADSNALESPIEDSKSKYGKRTSNKIESGRYALEGGQVYDQSLWRALFLTGRLDVMKAIALVLTSFMLQIAAPLLSKVLIDEFTRAKAYRDALGSGQSVQDLIPPHTLGFSFGICVALLVMLIVSSVFRAHGEQRFGLLGLSLRGAVIDLISRKTMRLSSKARQDSPQGQINALVTSDSTTIERSVADQVIMAALIPQLIVGCGLLIWQLGYSALVALAILAASGPVQVFALGRFLKYRNEHQGIMDQRVSLLTEVVGNIRTIKLYAYETLFGLKVAEKRKEELKVMRRITLMNSISRSFMFFIPTVAAVCAFIVFAAAGNPLDAGKLFTSLQFLTIMRAPIAWFPRIIAAAANALISARRIGTLLQAEEQADDMNIERDLPYAVSVKGSFQYETTRTQGHADERAVRGAVNLGAKLEDLKKRLKSPLSTPISSQIDLGALGSTAEKNESVKEPFILKDVNLDIPHGALVCIVGRVGAGKSTLLGSMINEVRKVSGQITFGGSISYVPQHAWVQSGTIPENITFSAERSHVDLDRVAAVVEACCLSVYLEKLDEGDLTKIGERGITLSGGQRQRICVARAAYEDTDVVLLDDPLSAVDAQVGQHILHKCILSGPLAGRTRILVTHHLDVLPLADMILMMQGDGEVGQIVQQGSYQDLMMIDGPFRSLVNEYGSKTTKEEEDDAIDEVQKTAGASADKEGDALHMEEDRETGAVALSTYGLWVANMGHWSLVLLLGMLFVIAQIASIANILWLGWWGGNRFSNLSRGAYMGVYAGIGLMFALCLFLSTCLFAVLALHASFSMFGKAWQGVLRCPAGWHDRTPTGRIISRLSGDVYTMDYWLADVTWHCITNSLSMVGTFALVVYVYPWLGLAFIPVVLFTIITIVFYSKTSREINRVESVMRSFVFGNIGEQYAGLAIIKAFRKQARFQLQMQSSLDEQSKLAAIRAVAIFGVATRDESDPYRFGIVLTYVMTAAFVLQDLIPNVAQVEQEMNNVERVGHYTKLESEGESIRSTDPIVAQWPSKGTITFDNFQLRYRPELPLVLKGLNSEIRPGEKVGIIGRTGAGKSSLVQALYRTVELVEGKICIDDQDIAALGLETLRSRLSIIPQESFLFAGSVRENIDPAGLKSDADLNNALALISANTAASSSLRDKFRLETDVQAEGANFSAGERQLLALMRALVRGCKILVLDEATSSVDPETDALIQRIIQSEFSHVTLISIAHRLQTVAYYDRILVMDAGVVAKFDSPLILFDRPDSIFRSLCDTKQITRDDLVRIQADAVKSA